MSVNTHLNKILLLVMVAAAGLLLASCSDDSKKKAGKSTNTAASTTKKNNASKVVTAPDFTLKKMDGSPFTLSTHRGEVVVLNVWATWCGPCRKEIPDFIEIQKALRDQGVLFVGISVDKNGWKAVRPFAKKYDINYPLTLADRTFLKEYGPFRAIPVTFIIDKKGKIAYGGAGRINTQSLEKVLKKMASK